ncbi:MAG: TIGR00270 family protein [Candidatus Methanomethylophilaceae archaeon]|nr:TIGR00270 family protein [Candidatus Methanomethylophilaceae archaeon]MBQ7978245.1 TIGR00270 family protein [Candidatus Methanomethylophilaceae archaeon]MBQ9690448.1 TIGR00270 family protein [Candidatus Methanomethylophilaceae archaeon]MBR4202495.1 TIGR00270 family protein [Candidatus Methanomethylophilaceae archaeon]MBR6911051.1 TIGR00270 family protein [Candidatus Methanomethylophilaceae archaeon]
MCGKEVPLTKTVVIEGSRLNVCPNCARFGEDYRANQSGAPISTSVIDQRLEKREKRMKTKDIYAGTSSVELVDDYGGVIREARVAKGMDLEQFAASILEKKGTLAKIESNSLVPDDKIIKKIEKALGIKLTETVKTGVTVGGGNGNNKMTLGNFIKKE